MIKTNPYLGASALSLATCLTAAPVSAQTAANSDSASDADSPVIVVTARKRDEVLTEVPLSIIAISSETIDNDGLTDVRDVAKTIPGLTFDRTNVQNDFRPAIRGLQAEQGRTSVGILIDGIDLTSENLQVSGGGSLARLRLADVEQIEVVKGPQAALYGRSAFGGAINYVTKRPSLTEMDGKITLDGHSEEGFEFKGSIGTPLIEDRLGIRLNGYVFDERGSYRNTVSGNFVGGGDGFGISGAILAEPVDNLSLYGRLEYSDETYGPQPAFVIAGNSVIQLDANAQTVVGAPTATIFTGPLTDAPVAYDVDPRTGEEYRGIDVEYFRASMIADLDLGGVGITSLTSFIQAESDIFQDNDFVSGSVGGVVTGGFQETQRIADTEQFSQEIRIFSQGGGRLQWLAGALYWDENVTQFGSEDTGLAFGPISDEDVEFFFRSRDGAGRFVIRDTLHRSIFGWAEFEVVDSLFASVEGRYTWEDIDYTLDFDPAFVFFNGVASTGPGNDPAIIPLGVVTGFFEESIEESYFTPRFSVSYRPNLDLNVYASAAKAVKPSGFQTGSVFELNLPYDRETLWAYEAGVKSVVANGDLAFNTAVFYQDYSNQQVSSQIVNQATGLLQPVIENAGKSTIWGIEVDATWRATNELTLSAAYAFTDAEFDTFRVVSTSANRIAESGCAEIVQVPGGNPACLLVRDGNKPADLPTHQLNLNGSYETAISETFDGFISTSARYTSKRFLSTSNVATQPDYWNVDGQIGVTNGDLRVALYVENLFNDDTITDGFLYVDFFNGFAPAAFGYRPDPRKVGLRVNYSF